MKRLSLLFPWDCLNGGDNASQLPGAYLTTRDGNALPPAAVVSRRNLKIPSLHSLPSKLILISSVLLLSVLGSLAVGAKK